MSRLPRQVRARDTSNRNSTLAALALLLACLCGCASTPRSERDAVFFPEPPAAPRVQYLTHFSSADQVIPDRGGLSKLVFGDETPGDAVAKPYGLALHDGKLYVCDTKLNAVVIFDLAQDRFGYCGVTGPERLHKPVNICVDDEGLKYVADAERGEIVVIDRTDTWAGTFGGADLERPVDVALHDGLLYVCDAAACRIVVFDTETRQRVNAFGGKGTAPGQFARPTNLAVDSDGSIYVSDTLNGRIQKLTPDGSPLSTIGRLGDRPGDFARPKGLAVDDQGRVFVVDAAFENVQAFDESGRVLMFFGGPGDGPGHLVLPAQVIVDHDHVDLFRDFIDPGFDARYLVLVTSQYGPRKVSVYAVGRAVGKAVGNLDEDAKP